MLSVICSENMHAYDRIKKRTQLYNVKVRVSAAKDAKGFSQRLSLNFSILMLLLGPTLLRGILALLLTAWYMLKMPRYKEKD